MLTPMIDYRLVENPPMSQPHSKGTQRQRLESKPCPVPSGRPVILRFSQAVANCQISWYHEILWHIPIFEFHQWLLRGRKPHYPSYKVVSWVYKPTNIHAVGIWYGYTINFDVYNHIIYNRDTISWLVVLILLCSSWLLLITHSWLLTKTLHSSCPFDVKIYADDTISPQKVAR